ncbi:MAG: hypothetical protein UZ05_CHB002002170 [Chlorobi bacterium OLB5]|nr:MAG: hypothetical protein UZ05_CHB002002170 [Chlorobi bacterium OLB5]
MKVVLAKYPVEQYIPIINQLPDELVNERGLRDMMLYNQYVDLRMVHNQVEYISQLAELFQLSHIQVKRIIAAGRKYFKNKIIIKSNAA